MASVLTNIIPRKLAEALQTTQWTSTGKTLITKFTATNTSGVNVTFSCNLVANGGSVGSSNLVLKERVIQPGETYLCPELVGQSLEPGGFISTLPGAGSAIVISSSGLVIT